MHLYVHVPFCARRCSYCDFAIAVRGVTPDEAFAAAILREWDGRRNELSDAPLRTIYFGGGTPSRLSTAALDCILGAVRDRHAVAADAEITLEANPDDVDPARATMWARSGVNRVSLGVQSHDDAVLRWMHRTHRAEQVPVAVRTLRDAGITNLSLDLIFALPLSLARDWQADLAETIALDPAHVSLYGLTVEPKTPLHRWTERGSAIPAADERYADEYLTAHHRLSQAGLDHYEVSNAGRPGYHAHHNAAYWSGADYLGLGPSAHSLLGGRRSWNVRDWVAYQQASERGAGMEAGHERLDHAARTLERRYLGLRTSDGLEPGELPAGTAERWRASGWATLRDGRIRLTPEGWLRLDALVAAAGDS